LNTLKIYGTGSATANAVAQIIIPNKSRIKGVQWSLLMDSITDGATLRVELSRASATEIAVNGAQQCISEVGMYGNFVTSGLAQFSQVVFLPCDVSVVQGQIIYLHAVVAGTLNYFAMGNIHYD